MKPRFSNKPTAAALTKIEVVVIVAGLAILAALFLPALAAAKRKASHISCVSCLKQIGLSFRLWEGDNHDKYPMAVSVTNGGAMELVATGNVAACFRVMSNEVNTPRILLCPEDACRVWATNFSTLNNSNISYFVGLDVTNDTNPQMFLSGDDNFAIGGVPIKPGVLQLLTNTPVNWTKVRHKLYGNIGFADSSVQQLTTDGLQQALQQTGVATNRLAIP
jgi:competence protein ComGC